ncbi:MAG: nitrate reductase molybdenum cofactor assembly chaperone [Alphaproteobacteria bacterium]
MTKSFKVLSLLLSYPDQALQAAAPELTSALDDEALLPARERRAVGRLLDDLASADLYDAQARYVQLFDRTRSLSLHLFEHVHGEGRERGQALVDLAQVYDDGGFDVVVAELPDFLPLFLEYLSTRPLPEARLLLAEPLHILQALHERLRKRRSVYAGALAALVALAQCEASATEVEALLAQADDEPDDLTALDRAWEDAPVTFGPGCGNGG